MKKVLVFIVFAVVVSCRVMAGQSEPADSAYIAQIQDNIIEIKSVSDRVDYLSKQLVDLEYFVEKQKDIIDQEQSAIDNSLSASGRLLEIFGFILAVGGVVLGWYISRKEKSVQKILRIVEEKQLEALALKNEVDKKKNDMEVLRADIEATSMKIEKMREEINGDIEGLYQRLRREETVTLLKRLVAVPQDISNVSEMLLARQLEDEDFGLLHQAYNALMIECAEEAASYKSSYLLLFFQHFCGKSLLTVGLKNDLIGYFSTALSCAFKVDVVNSTSSMVEAFNVGKEGDVYEVFCKYLSALAKSRHAKYIEPYRVIATKCSENIDLRIVWDKLVEKRVVIELFGMQLCARYCNDSEFVHKVQDRQAKENAGEKIEDTNKNKLSQ